MSFGGTIGRPLVHKLVKPVKVARSCLADKILRYEVVVVKAKSKMWATHVNPFIRSEET